MNNGVATVTLNPAIDHTIYVNTFTPNTLTERKQLSTTLAAKA